MYTLYYHKKTIDVASSWNELTARKLIAITSVIQSKLAFPAKRLLALRILSNKNPVSFAFMHPDFVARCLQYIDWVFEENTLTTQHLKSYKYFFQKRLYAPSNDFDNLTLGEFHYCEMMYHRLVSDKSEMAMNDLIAVLYREKKAGYNKKRNTDGDIRAPFNHNEVAYRSAKIASWPNAVKHAIIYWYDGCRQNLTLSYPAVFEGGEKQPTKMYFDGLFGLMRNIAGPRYGLLENVEKLNVHTAMMEMVYCKEEADKISKETAK